MTINDIIYGLTSIIARSDSCIYQSAPITLSPSDLDVLISAKQAIHNYDNAYLDGYRDGAHEIKEYIENALLERKKLR